MVLTMDLSAIPSPCLPNANSGRDLNLRETRLKRGLYAVPVKRRCLMSHLPIHQEVCISRLAPPITVIMKSPNDLVASPCSTHLCRPFRWLTTFLAAPNPRRDKYAVCCFTCPNVQIISVLPRVLYGFLVLSHLRRTS